MAERMRMDARDASLPAPTFEHLADRVGGQGSDVADPECRILRPAGLLPDREIAEHGLCSLVIKEERPLAATFSHDHAALGVEIDRVEREGGALRTPHAGVLQ